MIRTAVIPVLLALICARQAVGAPDGPDAQGTRGGLSAHFQNEASLRSNLRAEPERYRRRRSSSSSKLEEKSTSCRASRSGRQEVREVSEQHRGAFRRRRADVCGASGAAPPQTSAASGCGPPPPAGTVVTAVSPALPPSVVDVLALQDAKQSLAAVEKLSSALSSLSDLYLLATFRLPHKLGGVLFGLYSKQDNRKYLELAVMGKINKG